MPPDTPRYRFHIPERWDVTHDRVEKSLDIGSRFEPTFAESAR